MITAITIENLRGISSGRLEELAPLTILTGPNASGKSTVLDALLIVASSQAHYAVGRAVQRHPATPGGARWLVSSSGHRAQITAEDAARDIQWSRSLVWSPSCDDELETQLVQMRARPPFSTVSTKEGISFETAISTDNQFVVSDDGDGFSSGISRVHLEDPGIPRPLHRTFTEMIRAGRRAEIYGLLTALIPGFEQLEILVDDADNPVLHLSSQGVSVPLALAGDGIQAFVQLALESAMPEGSLFLIEEPEVYQHPKAIWQNAKVLLANMHRGVQTVLTTHSLELIDAILSETTEDDLEKVALFNLNLDRGRLISSCRTGQEIVFARQELEKDLR